jgi:hypothetical protein
MSEYRNIILFFPVISGYMMENICPINIQFDNFNIKINSLIFNLVWTLMYFILGYTWKYEQSKEINKYYILNVFLSMLWIYFYSCLNDKVTSKYILLLINCVSYIILSKIKEKNNKYLLSIYILLLHFITILNFYG